MADAFSFSITGDTALIANLARLSDEMRGAAIERAVVAGALLVRNAAVQRARVKTGNLRRSIHVGEPWRSGDTVSVEVGTDLEYAAIHEYGGVVTPKNGKVLAWVTRGKRPTSAAGWKKARKEGRVAFAKKVHIPARPYLRPALDENVAEVQEEIAKALAKLVKAALQ
ncbi:MAG: HK97 gp10 family phage protein [Chloroflexi bacterium]|nr:HK97 gp10 family phage protein [Chloroflexota bacterium]